MKTIERSVNLCTYYLLPLIGLNRHTFGKPENFINCYIADDRKHLVVELTEFPLSLENHANYKFDFEHEGAILVVFEMPVQYLPTVIKFMEGKYSKFSDEVKSIIKKKSGLRWNVPLEGGKTVSAKELLALDRDRVLREKLEEQLNIHIPIDAELMSSPYEEQVIFKLGLYAQQSH